MEKRKRKVKKNVKIILAVLGTLMIVSGVVLAQFHLDFSTSKKQEVPKEEEKIEEEPKRIETEASLIMVGDALIHNSVYNDAKTGDGGYDFTPMLSEIKPIVEDYDLAYYNQETILGGTELGLSNYPRFNSPKEVGDAFLDAGFNLVSVASNHTMDKGEEGVLSSLDYWKSKDAYVAGSYSSFEERDKPVIKEVNGITYSFLAYTMWNNGLSTPTGKEYLNNEYSDELAKADIERVRDQVDVVIVAMHWGTEYSLNVSAKQKEVASYLASLGVDIIIGAHPHVVEPIEFIDDTMVIYSLGNLISDQEGVERLTGLMAAVTIKKVVDDGVTTITLENPKADLVYTYSSMSGKRNFKVYPYSQLNNTILPNYMSYYEKYKSIVTSMSDRIEMTSLDLG